MQKLIDDLRLSRKFLLVGVLALVMLAVPLGLVLSTGLASLSRSATALSGVAPAVAVAQEIQLMQQHRAQAANVLSGNEAARAPREALQARSIEAMQAQLSAAQAYGNAPIEQRVRKMQSDWAQLTQAVGQRSIDTAESFRRHSALIDEQLDILRALVDSAGLALLPQPSGHYLVVAALDYLPRLSEALGQARAAGVALLNGGQADPAGQARVGALVNAARLYDRHAQGALALAMADSAVAQQALAAPATNAQKVAAEAFQMVTQKIVEAQALDTPAADYLRTITAQIDVQMDLLRKATEVMSDDVAARNREVRQLLITTTAIAVAIAALAFWILLLVSRSTTRSATGPAGARHGRAHCRRRPAHRAHHSGQGRAGPDADRPGRHEREPAGHRQHRFAKAATALPPVPARWRQAAWTSRSAPRSRPATWSRPRPRWNNWPAPCATTPTWPAKRLNWQAAPARSPRTGARW